MGSLVPGWDVSSPGHVSKGFEDYNDDDNGDNLGYFESLARLRRLRASVDGAPKLSRSSAPHLMRRASMAAGAADAIRGSSDKAAATSSRPVLQRLSSLPAHPGERVDALAQMAPGTPHSTASGSLDGYRVGSQPNEATAWWRTLDSAALNEPPRDDSPQANRGYVPQHAVAGNALRYRGLTAAHDSSDTASPTSDQSSTPLVTE